jgi:hypothetical protein
LGWVEVEIDEIRPREPVPFQTLVDEDLADTGVDEDERRCSVVAEIRISYM